MDNITISSTIGQQDLQALVDQLNRKDGVSATLAPSTTEKATLTITVSVDGKSPVKVDITNPDLEPTDKNSDTVTKLEDLITKLEELAESLKNQETKDPDPFEDVDVGFSMMSTILLLQKVSQELRKALKEIKSQEYSVAAQQSEKEAESIIEGGDEAAKWGYWCAGISTAMTTISTGLSVYGAGKQISAYKSSGYGDAKAELSTARHDLKVAQGETEPTQLHEMQDVNDQVAIESKGNVEKTKGAYEADRLKLEELNVKVKDAKGHVTQAESELKAAEKGNNPEQIEKAKANLAEKNESLAKLRNQRDEQIVSTQDSAKQHIDAVKAYKDEVDTKLTELKKAGGNDGKIASLKAQSKLTLSGSHKSYMNALQTKLDQCYNAVDVASNKFACGVDAKKADLVLSASGLAKALGDSVAGLTHATGEGNQAAKQAEAKQHEAAKTREQMAMDETDKADGTRDLMQLTFDLTKMLAQSHQNVVNNIFA